ncbi:MAG: response regulator, partial [Planctomycetota bacterium]
MRSTPESEPAPAADRERLVLIADAVIDEGKATASTLASWGLQPLLVHDGVEAILTIQRTLPRAVVIDAALPKMYGFQICELLKRNESLRDIHVVLVGAIHDRNRYRRSPTELYGADAYLERQQLPDALRPILQGFGVPLR